MGDGLKRARDAAKATRSTATGHVYRERTDNGATVRALQKSNGDWLIDDGTVGSFRAVSDWYFKMTYAPDVG
jgi:hypothetical protein